MHGYQTTLGIDETAPVAFGFEFLRADLAKRVQRVETAGLTGRRALLDERVRSGTIAVSGAIELAPNLAAFERLLPWVLGAPAVDGLFTPADRVTSRVVQIDKLVHVATYTHCFIRRATFWAEPQQPLRLRLELFGQDETLDAAGSFPAVVHLPGAPLLFADSRLTVDSVAQEVRAWSVTIDHHLEPQHRQGALARDWLSRGRTITLRVVEPALSTTAPSPLLADRHEVRLELVRGAVGMTFEFPALQWTDLALVVDSQHALQWEREGIARARHAQPELLLTVNGV